MNVNPEVEMIDLGDRATELAEALDRLDKSIDVASVTWIEELAEDRFRQWKEDELERTCREWKFEV